MLVASPALWKMLLMIAHYILPNVVFRTISKKVDKILHNKLDCTFQPTHCIAPILYWTYSVHLLAVN